MNRTSPAPVSIFSRPWRRLGLLLCGIALIGFQATDATARPKHARKAVSQAIKHPPLYNTPVYNSETKSYFELVWLPVTVGVKSQINSFWEVAEKRARERVYKNRQGKVVKGRLAKVKSDSVNQFLFTTFRPRESVWFGLLYECASGKLFWSDGEALDPNDYTNWHPRKWANEHDYRASTLACHPEAPQEGEHYVYGTYTARPEPFKWALSGWRINHYAMLVEYPTGGE